VVAPMWWEPRARLLHVLLGAMPMVCGPMLGTWCSPEAMGSASEVWWWPTGAATPSSGAMEAV